MRCIPQITAYQRRFGEIQSAMSLGLAAHLLYMKTTVQPDGTYVGMVGEQPYLITDAHAAIFAEAWLLPTVEEAITALLSNTDLWSINLQTIPGLVAATTQWLHLLQQHGALETMELFNQQKTVLANAS